MSEMDDRRHELPQDRETGRQEVQTPHDALPAYALGTLDVDDQRLFELHLFVCQACRADLAAYQRAAGLLPYGLEPERPPVGARDRLLARARAEGTEAPTVSIPMVGGDESPTVSQLAPLPSTTEPAEPVTVEVVPVPAETQTVPPVTPMRRVQRQHGLRIKLASLGWAAALLVMLALGAGVWTWGVTGPHASPEMEMLARLPGGQVLDLYGTGVPTASARLFVADNGRRAELAIDALPPLRAGQVYQLWFAEPGQPIRTGGAFLVDARGDTVVQVTIPTPLERVRAVAVTQEPAPGSPGPTGAHLLDWTP